MFGIDLTSIMDGPIVVYLMFFAVGFLIVQGLFGLFGQAHMNKQLNARLKAREKAGSVQQLILELRSQRALNSDGEMSSSLRWFNQLVTRSGLTYEPGKWAAIAGVAVTRGAQRDCKKPSSWTSSANGDRACRLRDA